MNVHLLCITNNRKLEGGGVAGCHPTKAFIEKHVVFFYMTYRMWARTEGKDGPWKNITNSVKTDVGCISFHFHFLLAGELRKPLGKHRTRGPINFPIYLITTTSGQCRWFCRTLATEMLIALPPLFQVLAEFLMFVPFQFWRLTYQHPRNTDVHRVPQRDSKCRRIGGWLKKSGTQS